MSSKQIGVRLAGQGTIVDIEINENTTAAEVLSEAGCAENSELSPAVGQPPFGKDEKIFDRVADGGKLIASPPAIAGRK